MPFENRNCPGCGANIQVDTSRESVFCSYCGAKFSPSKRAGNSGHSAAIAKQHEAAEKLFAAGKYSEARYYWHKAIELDPTYGEARVGLCRVWLKEEILNPKKIDSDTDITNKIAYIDHSLATLAKLDNTDYLMALDYASPDSLSRLKYEFDEAHNTLHAMRRKCQNAKKVKNRTAPALFLALLIWGAVLWGCSFIISLFSSFVPMAFMFVIGIAAVIVCFMAAGKVYKRFKYR